MPRVRAVWLAMEEDLRMVMLERYWCNGDRRIESDDGWPEYHALMRELNAEKVVFRTYKQKKRGVT